MRSLSLTMERFALRSSGQTVIRRGLNQRDLVWPVLTQSCLLCRMRPDENLF